MDVTERQTARWEPVRPAARGRLWGGLRAQKPMDLPFLVLVLLALVAFGLVMLFSASYAVALYRRGDAYAYIRPQLLYAALGLAAMWLASRVDYHLYHKLAWPVLGVSLVLLTVVLFMPEYNGCKRWLVIPGVGTLQPSEIAKFAVVLAFAHIISLNASRMGSFAVGVLPFGLVLGGGGRADAAGAPSVGHPADPGHRGGADVRGGHGAAVVRPGGGGRCGRGRGGGGRHARPCALRGQPPGLLAGPPLPTPWGTATRPSRACTPSARAGPPGWGWATARQKHLFVPEPQNDFIFSILCEELGFVGALAVVGLFILLLLRGITLAVRAPDRFGGLLVVGFVVQVAMQAALNIAVVTNTIPNTGISLPFFSSGGTSLMMLLGEMGIVLSVSRQEA